MDFHPKHAQPFTYAQAKELEPALLAAEITRLENSIAHLVQSQDEIAAFIESEGDGDGEFRGAMEENEGVISSQRERILMIRLALVEKVGKEGLGHYGLESPAETSAPQPDTIPPNGAEDGLGGAERTSVQESTQVGDHTRTLTSRPAEADQGLHL